MKIISPAFANNGRINKKYTCNGENINPPLEFVDVPEKAKSLVLNFFKLYALDTTLDLPEGVSKKEIEQATQKHIIAQAELIGLYEQSIN